MSLSSPPPQSKQPAASRTQSQSTSSPELKISTTASKWMPHEERLQKAWRGVGTTVAACLSKAEKAAAAAVAAAATTAAATSNVTKTGEMADTAVAADEASTNTTTAADMKQKTKRELEECIVLFLRTRREFHRLLSHVEAKLQGKAEEMESLETYVRTQPRIGNNTKRRRLT